MLPRAVTNQHCRHPAFLGTPIAVSWPTLTGPPVRPWNMFRLRGNRIISAGISCQKVASGIQNARIPMQTRALLPARGHRQRRERRQQVLVVTLRRRRAALVETLVRPLHRAPRRLLQALLDSALEVRSPQTLGQSSPSASKSNLNSNRSEGNSVTHLRFREAG